MAAAVGACARGVDGESSALSANVPKTRHPQCTHSLSETCRQRRHVGVQMIVQRRVLVRENCRRIASNILSAPIHGGRSTGAGCSRATSCRLCGTCCCGRIPRRFVGTVRNCFQQTDISSGPNEGARASAPVVHVTYCTPHVSYFARRRFRRGRPSGRYSP